VAEQRPVQDPNKSNLSNELEHHEERLRVICETLYDYRSRLEI
jgi:hypothetical protein